ncbi:hypothetical protein ACFQX6_67300 [Streptosporangium lutulentum]
MATVHPLSARPKAPDIGPAAEAFLATIGNANTTRAYAIALRALTAELGERTPLTELEGEARRPHRLLVHRPVGRRGRGHRQRPPGRARLRLRLVTRSGLADQRPAAPHPPSPPHPGPNQGTGPGRDHGTPDPANARAARAHPVAAAV